MQNLGRILFIEDHPDVREALFSLLEDFGYEVNSVGSAEEGMARLETPGGFDLIVSDHSLPGQSGAWLIQEAVARGLIELQKPLDISYFLEEVAGKLPKAQPHRCWARGAWN